MFRTQNQKGVDGDGGGRVTLDFFGMSSWAHFGGTQWAEGLCLRKYPAPEDGLSVT